MRRGVLNDSPFRLVRIGSSPDTCPDCGIIPSGINIELDFDCRCVSIKNNLPPFGTLMGAGLLHTIKHTINNNCSSGPLRRFMAVSHPTAINCNRTSYGYISSCCISNR